MRLWGPLCVISILSIVTANVVWARMQRGPIRERLMRALQNEDLQTAEVLSWEFVQEEPEDLSRWIRFADVQGAMGSDPDEQPVVSQSSVHKLLARVADVRVREIASYWYEARSADTSPDPAMITKLADSQPPAQFANYVLGRVATEDEDWKTGAARLELEGFAFREHDFSLRRAIAIWMDNDAWNEVRKRMPDPRYDRALDARLRLEIAIHERNWPLILLWIWPSSFTRWDPWPVALAMLAAALWLVIAMRLGRVQDRVPGRSQLYAMAFLAGIVSIYPTLLTIVVEEDFLGLKELGQFVPDAIYFIFGVGLREEAWKLILFLPFVPTLLRRGSRLEVMTCGALVGLGFAAEENINYFHESGGAAALTRFLTANFFHMSLTALVALSVYDTRRGRALSTDRFNIVFPFVVLMHGSYDFFLTTNDMPLSSVFSITLLMIICRKFLRQLLIASSKAEERGMLYLLIASLAMVTGASYVYATTLAGPWAATRMIAIGVFGVAIVIYMFVRELSPG